MKPRLILKHEGVHLRTFTLTKDVTTVGRKTDNDIQIDDGAISGHHARFVMEPSDYLEGHHDIFIEDMGSTNGTMVNGVGVEKQLLKHGDVIDFGKHQLTYDSGQANLETTAIYLPDS